MYALRVLTLGNLRIKKLNALLMIGNVVLAPVITVILVSNYIRINVKALAKRFMFDHKLNISLLALKLNSGLKLAA